MKAYSVTINSNRELRTAMRQIDRALGNRGVAFVRFPDGTLAARRDKRGVWVDFSPRGGDVGGGGAKATAWGAER
jgi:hypothetical protein